VGPVTKEQVALLLQSLTNTNSMQCKGVDPHRGRLVARTGLGWDESPIQVDPSLVEMIQVAVIGSNLDRDPGSQLTCLVACADGFAE
jgi:hypothetical protein